MRLITQASNTNEPFAYDENVNWDFELVDKLEMDVCLKEEDVIIPKLLHHIADC